MSIISKYIFKQIGSYFLYITIFFISLIWLILSLKFIEYVTTNGLEFKDFIGSNFKLNEKIWSNYNWDISHCILRGDNRPIHSYSK